MKIAFDAKRLFMNDTGLGNFSRTLVSEIHALDSAHELLLFSPKVSRTARTEAFHSTDYQIVTLNSRLPSVVGAYWRSQRLGHVIRKYQPTVFHGLSNEVPADISSSGVPSVVTVHDLIFLHYPAYYSKLDVRIYKHKLLQACQNADRIVAISQQTARDLETLVSAPSKKISVIYQGCDPSFRADISIDEKARVTQKLNIERDFILSIGTLEERKNQLTLVKAFHEGQFHEQFDLVLVGRQKAYAKKIHDFLADKPTTKNSVRFIDRIDFLDLPALLSASRCMVYPSRYEGFGLPVLEAQKCGVPVIAASGSCLEETGGTAAEYFQPDDVQQLVMLLAKILNDAAKRAEMIEKGRLQSEKFSNQKMAQQYLDLYQSLANE